MNCCHLLRTGHSCLGTCTCFSGVTHILLGPRAGSGVMDSSRPAAGTGTGQPPACPGGAASPRMGRSHVTRKVPLLRQHTARGRAMLLQALRTPVITPGWHIWETASRKHALLLYELEAICPKCEAPGLVLCCVSLSAHKEENSQVCPSVSRLWSVCSCCPQRCGHPDLRPAVHGRQL